jgi:NADH-quinone oxidoreductase subunit M
MFFLIGIWGNKERERAANQFLLYNGIGSALMLIAFIILISTAGFSFANPTNPNYSGILYYSGSYDMIKLNLLDPQSFANAKDILSGLFYLSPALKSGVFILLLVAFGIKLPIFPFHTWMLKVHKEAPTSVVMIHSGILLKMGAYGLFRFGLYFFPEQAEKWALALAVLGVINILYGAILAFVQEDLRLVLAYSSISHMGVVLLGIASLNQYGVQGAAYQLISHGLISALMFLLVGILYERTGTTELNRLGGLAKTMPFASAVLLISGMASLGLPSTSGFVAEFLAFLGVFSKYPAIAIVGTLGIVLTAVYVLRAVLKITYGPLEASTSGLSDVKAIEIVPMITLVAVIVLLGVYPAYLTNLLGPTLDSIMSWIGG